MDREQGSVERFLKLGYQRDNIVRVLKSLRPDAQTNDILEELIKTCRSRGSAAVAATGNHGNASPQLVPRGCGSPLPHALSTRVTPHTHTDGFRSVVIDGSNVAMSHGNKQVFSCRGVQLAVQWFWDKGVRDVIVFVPLWRKEQPRPEAPITAQHILTELEKRQILVFTPSRFVNGKRVVCYDDRYIVKFAYDSDGIIVSNDNYRDLQAEKPEWKTFIEERLLMYTFANDMFMPPDDPLGRNGPTIDNFLRKRPKNMEHKQLLCLYGKKCTYGMKCKFYHPERINQSHLSVADELRAKSKPAAEEDRTYASSLSATGQDQTYTSSFSATGQDQTYASSFSATGQDQTYASSFSATGQDQTYASSFSATGQDQTYASSFSATGQDQTYTSSFHVTGGADQMSRVDDSSLTPRNPPEMYDVSMEMVRADYPPRQSSDNGGGLGQLASAISRICIGDPPRSSDPAGAYAGISMATGSGFGGRDAYLERSGTRSPALGPLTQPRCYSPVPSQRSHSPYSQQALSSDSGFPLQCSNSSYNVPLPGNNSGRPVQRSHSPFDLALPSNDSGCHLQRSHSSYSLPLLGNSFDCHLQRSHSPYSSLSLSNESNQTFQRSNSSYCLPLLGNDSGCPVHHSRSPYGVPLLSNVSSRFTEEQHPTAMKHRPSPGSSGYGWSQGQAEEGQDGALDGENKKRRSLRAQLSTLFPQSQVDQVMAMYPHILDTTQLVELIKKHKTTF